MKKYGFIYNPAARRNRETNVDILSKFVEQLPGSKIYYSESREHISELIAKIYNDFEVIVACGGDGTIREVASQLIGKEKTLGIIPLGTGNDLSKTLKIPGDVTAALKLLLNGRTIKIDVGQCNDFIFLNSLGFGFDGLTNFYAHQMEWLPPTLQYVIAALRSNLHHKPFRLKITTEDKTSIDQNLIMATLANGRVEGGSFWIAPEASMTDGKLNLITIRPISRWLIPLLLPLFLLKRGSWIPHVSVQEVERITLSFEDEIAIHADGEILYSNLKEFHISLRTSELDVICGM